MNKREVVIAALSGQPVPYTPWNFGFTEEPHRLLVSHYGLSSVEDLREHLDNHLLWLGGVEMEPIGDERYRDHFGVIWNRSVDHDIGVVENRLLPEPDLTGLVLPDPLDERFWAGIGEKMRLHRDLYSVYGIGFSLFERAWTMRGMTELLIDFCDSPDFVRELLRRLADWNILQVTAAIDRFNPDAIYFGDDWGQQHGLIMGYPLWKEFIYPELCRMYGAARSRGKQVFIHSCGDVDELFDDLIVAGVNCFNPFQPEVMDVPALFEQYRGRLSFYGGLSTQKTLPYGTRAEVTAESERLLSMGRRGGYIFSPAHAVEGDVPLENLLAFIDAARLQPGFIAK